MTSNRRIGVALAAGLLLAACGGSATPSSAPTMPSTPNPASALPSSPASPAATPAATGEPAPYRPTPRSGATMAWDPTHEVVLLFGGSGGAGVTNDLDAWDGTAWHALATDGPPPRDDALLVADPERGVMVLTGGRAGGRVFTDTWVWDGTTWAERDVDGPPARVHAAAAFDATSKRVIVYGGVGTDDVTRRDTWAWDGTSWEQLDETGIPDRVPTHMAWDPILGQVVTLAVDLRTEAAPSLYASELWAWTGAAWKRVGEGPPPFSPLQSFVEGPRHPIFVDGGALQDRLTTMEWNGESWDSIATGGPSPRNGQAVAFDATRHELVLFGGFLDGVDLGDTWRLTGGAWQEVLP